MGRAKCLQPPPTHRPPASTARAPVPGIDENAEGGGLAVLDAIGTVASVSRDQPLFCEGDAADRCYKVVSGALRSCKLLANGPRHVGDFFLPGDFIGFNSRGTHAFAAEAVTSATLVRYERHRVEALVSRSPHIAKCLLARLCSDLSEAQCRMLQLGWMTAQERMASFIRSMANRGSGKDPASPRLPMTRADIGATI